MWIVYKRWRDNPMWQGGTGSLPRGMAVLWNDILIGLGGIVQSIPGITLPWGIVLAVSVAVIAVAVCIMRSKKNANQDRKFALFCSFGAITALIHASVIAHTSKFQTGRYLWAASSVFALITLMALFYLLRELSRKLPALSKSRLLAKGLVVILAAGCVIPLARTDNNFFYDRGALTMHKTLESYAGVPWLYYTTDDNSYEFYNIVFDFRIPGEIKRVGIDDQTFSDEKLVNTDQVIVYTLDAGIEGAAEYISKCTGRACEYEKIMDRANAQVYLVTIE